MKYNRRIKNKNIGYFIVRGRVFNTLHQAEEYCRENGLDLDEEILSENADVLKEAKAISRSALPILKNLQKRYDNEYQKQCSDYDRKIKEYKDSLNVRDLLRGLKYEHAIEQLGVLKGMHILSKHIRQEIEILESILRIPGGN